MPLVSCPECEAQISSRAQSCPKCGYPFKQPMTRPQPADTVVVTWAKRPFGIFLGIAMCVIGLLLLLSRSSLILPSYFHSVYHSLIWELHWRFDNLWRLLYTSPLCQIFGLLLLCLGIVELIFGSTKLKKAASVV